jgi:hypothetical protein
VIVPAYVVLVLRDLVLFSVPGSTAAASCGMPDQIPVPCLLEVFDLSASYFPVSIPVIAPVYVVSPLFLVDLSDLVLIPYDRFALADKHLSALLVLAVMVVELSDLVLILYDRFAAVLIPLVVPVSTLVIVQVSVVLVLRDLVLFSVLTLVEDFVPVLTASCEVHPSPFQCLSDSEVHPSPFQCLSASYFPVSTLVIVQVSVVAALVGRTGLVPTLLLVVPAGLALAVLVAAVLFSRDLVLFAAVLFAAVFVARDLVLFAVVLFSGVLVVMVVEPSALLLVVPAGLALAVFVALLAVFVALVVVLFVMLVGMSPMSMTPMSA